MIEFKIVNLPYGCMMKTWMWLSEIEDADITEAITDLSEKELVYRAALASSAKVMELNLVDYLE